jgi:hypothetical protein
MRRNLVIFTLLASAFVGCKMDPAPPSEADAKQVWLNVRKQLRLDKDVELVDLKKTDGQLSEVNGVKIYTFYYELHKRHLTPMGHWKPGEIETVKSNYGFQKTEQGWQGPDGTVFPN